MLTLNFRVCPVCPTSLLPGHQESKCPLCAASPVYPRQSGHRFHANQVLAILDLQLGIIPRRSGIVLPGIVSPGVVSPFSLYCILPRQSIAWSFIDSSTYSVPMWNNRKCCHFLATPIIYRHWNSLSYCFISTPVIYRHWNSSTYCFVSSPRLSFTVTETATLTVSRSQLTWPVHAVTGGINQLW